MRNLSTKEQLIITQSTDISARLKLAKSTQTISVLKVLLEDTNQKVRLCAIKNQASTQVVLARVIELYSQDLSSDATELLKCVGSHANASGTNLDELSKINCAKVLISLASNVAAKKELLASLANRTSDNNILKVIASNPKTSKETLSFLAEKSKTNSRIIIEITKNTNTSPLTLHEILVREINIKKVNPTLNKVATAILNNKSTQLRTYTLATEALNRKTTTNMPVPVIKLERITSTELGLGASEVITTVPVTIPAVVPVPAPVSAIKEAPVVKDNVSSNGSAKEIIIPTNSVKRTEFARHCDSEEILWNLSHDDNPYVRMEVIMNPRTPVKALTKFVLDSNPYVRQALAKVINDEKIMFMFANDPNPYVRTEVASRTDNELLLFHLSRPEENDFTRKAVACNKHSTTRVLENLLKGNPNPFILNALLLHKQLSYSQKSDTLTALGF